jgi:molybdenum cofactor guanylyltransferase
MSGGMSRRYGHDKAAALIGGVTMLDRAIAALTPVCDRVVVVTNASAVVDASVPVIRDLRPGLGPMGGLEAALTEATRLALPGVFLLGCDLPLVTPSVVRAVVDSWDGTAFALAPSREGGIESLCAVYSAAALESVQAQLDADRRSLHDLFERVDGVSLDLLELRRSFDPFLNVNTPEDRERAEPLLAREDD